MNKKTFSFLLLPLLVFLSGCSINFNSSGTDTGANDAGVYKSINQGDNWTQKVLIPTTTGKPKSFSSVNVLSMAMDPSDEKAIYAGTEENGLLYTYDGGNNWWLASALDKITINTIAVDPKDKCTIYIGTINKVMKTDDCSRTWAPTYFDNDLEETITSIAIDHYDNKNIYVGISRGEIIKSTDRGLSWRSLNAFGDQVGKIVISPTDSRIIFVATKKKGIYRSTDGGENWTDLNDSIKNFEDGLSFRDLAMSKSQAGLMILATKYGMLKSVDNGSSWAKITLLTSAEKNPNINSVAINQLDDKKIYYSTYTTFYRSADGGQTWSTKKLPSTRTGWKILIDPKTPDTIYLGIKEVKTSQFGSGQ